MVINYIVWQSNDMVPYEEPFSYRVISDGFMGDPQNMELKLSSDNS